ncbi:MAG: phosphotransacetylase family protein [Promethearchaeota archaeon]
MAKAIYLSACAAHVGKSMLAVGLLAHLKSKGKRVGYFRPFTRATSKDDVDEDAVVAANVLGSKTPTRSALSVHQNMFFETLEAVGRDEVLARIKAAYDEIASDLDSVIVEGNRLTHQFYSFDLCDAEIARALGADVVLVNSCTSDVSIDDLLVLVDLVRSKGASLRGVVFTDLTKDMENRVNGVFKPFLEKRGLAVLGVVPRTPALAAPTVAEVHEAIGGEVLVRGSEEKWGGLVEGFIIGAMNFASALRYLRRGLNKAVITGGDRSDILLAALDASTSLLVCTGNLRPTTQVLAGARERGVPVILVASDTFTTASRLKGIVPRIQVDEKEECARIVEEYLDLPQLI